MLSSGNVIGKNRTTCLVHAVFECEDCGKHWEWYLTAQTNARRHARKYNHTVRGDLGFTVTYSGKAHV